MKALLSHTLSDKCEIVDDESLARHSTERVTVVTVTRLVKEGVLVDVGCVVETSERVSDALVGEEGGETGRADQQEYDTLQRQGGREGR